MWYLISGQEIRKTVVGLIGGSRGDGVSGYVW